MRNCDVRLVGVIAAMVGVMACASGSGGVKPSNVKPPAVGAAALTPAALRVVRFTRILVNADCSATIDDLDIVGTPGMKIGWLVEDAGCAPEDDWHVELVFDRDWNNGRDRRVKIDPDDFKSLMVHRNTPVTGADGHDYKVYLVYERWGADIRVPVIDPEVDIEM